MIELIGYDKKYEQEFKNLNLEWLVTYNLLEEADMVVLNDPIGEVIQKGGFIFLARSGSEIVGTAAILQEHDQVYELAKMTVAPAWRGKGISKLLIEKCIQKAVELNAKKITLFSNHQLQAALGLYQKFGFKQVEVTGSPFVTADVKMELILDN